MKYLVSFLYLLLTCITIASLIQLLNHLGAFGPYHDDEIRACGSSGGLQYEDFVWHRGDIIWSYRSWEHTGRCIFTNEDIDSAKADAKRKFEVF